MNIREVGKDCVGVVHVMDTDVFISTGGYIKTNMSFFFLWISSIYLLFFAYIWRPTGRFMNFVYFKTWGYGNYNQHFLQI